MEHYDLSLRLAFYGQWLFIKVRWRRGHFSKQGQWHQSLLDGTNERVLPEIIERALALLPQTPEYDPVRRRARVSVCVSIADRHWWEGALSVRTHLVSTIRQYPWMVVEPRVVEQLRRVAGTLVSGPNTRCVPWTRSGVISVPPRLVGFRRPRRLRRLRGELVAETAFAMASAGSPRLAALMVAARSFDTLLASSTLALLVSSPGSSEVHRPDPNLLRAPPQKHLDPQGAKATTEALFPATVGQSHLLMRSSISELGLNRIGSAFRHSLV